MLRFACSFVMSLTFASLGGCANFDSTSPSNCTDGQSLVGGSCVPEITIPPEKSRTLKVGCTHDADATFFIFEWELTVDPGPIIAGEPFGAFLSGAVVFDEDFLDEAMEFIGGFQRVELLDLKATVHVRHGVEPGGAQDVVLTHEPGFIDIPTSDECGPGELCDQRGKQCGTRGFCVIDELSVPLQAEVVGYVAEGSGTVLFGWDDQSTGAELDDGEWVLPPAIFENEIGPNGIRLVIEGFGPWALECTMGVGTLGRFTRADDSDLISFMIQSP